MATSGQARENDELSPGTLVTPSLRLVRPLGGGGMGRVWIADHLGLHAQVVVKFIAAELSQHADVLARFSREAAAASQVKSPHVVHMIDHGLTTGGTPFIAMELLDGIDLRAHLTARGTLPPAEVAEIVRQVARALSAAHARGIVHRDIKPENVFLTDAGSGELFVKVLDFGIAKSAASEHSMATGTGAMIGTPYYMSPEQILGQKTIDFRADLWSVGVLAYEALTGALPFGGETVGALSVAICSGAAPRPSSANSSLGPAIDEWLLRTCAREPGGRWSSAREMADALSAAASASAGTRLSSGGFDDAPTLAMGVAFPARAGAVPPTAGRPTLGMLSTAGAAASAADSSPTPASSRTRVVLLAAAGALVLGGGIGLASYALTRGAPETAPSAPSPAAATPPSAGRRDLEPREEPVAPTVSASAPIASASTSAAAVSPRSTSQRPVTGQAIPGALAPTVSASAPPPMPTAPTKKANDVVLE